MQQAVGRAPARQRKPPGPLQVGPHDWMGVPPAPLRGAPVLGVGALKPALSAEQIVVRPPGRYAGPDRDDSVGQESISAVLRSTRYRNRASTVVAMDFLARLLAWRRGRPSRPAWQQAVLAARPPAAPLRPDLPAELVWTPTIDGSATMPARAGHHGAAGCDANDGSHASHAFGADCGGGHSGH
jgi:hypothetical protein